MEQTEKNTLKETATSLDAKFGKVTANYLAVRASSQFMRDSMMCALERGDSTFNLKNCDDSISLLMEKLNRCKADADYLRAAVAKQNTAGKLRKLDSIKYSLWLDELDAIHDAILSEDIRPQEETRARTFGAEGKIFRLYGGSVPE